MSEVSFLIQSFSSDIDIIGLNYLFIIPSYTKTSLFLFKLH